METLVHSYLLTLNSSAYIQQNPKQPEAGDCLNELIDDIGIPMNLRFDHAAQVSGPKTEFMKSIKRYDINWNVTEPYSH